MDENEATSLLIPTTGVSLAYFCYRLTRDRTLSRLSTRSLRGAPEATWNKRVCHCCVDICYGLLLAGYVSVSEERYAINWTLSQCVLTLKFMGTASDLRDGHRESSEDARRAKVDQLN